MAATIPIRDKRKLRELADYFRGRGQPRNYALVALGAYTALRISDLLRLRWSDVYDDERGAFYSHATIQESKTKKPKTIALNKQVIKALRLYLPYRRGAYVLTSNRKCGRAISRVQAWRIIHAAVLAVGIAGKVACHSLRKSWGYHAWTSGMVSPVVIMDLLNHSNYETTRRYLGIAQDDLDRAYLGMRLFG
jgi:integrase